VLKVAIEHTKIALLFVQHYAILHFKYVFFVIMPAFWRIFCGISAIITRKVAALFELYFTVSGDF